MTTDNLTNTCIETLEQVIDEKVPVATQHLETCETCKQISTTAHAIKTSGAPADYSDEFPGLKQRIMHKIEPVFRARYQQTSSVSDMFSAWGLKLALAGAAFLVLFAMFSSPRMPVSLDHSDTPLPIKLVQTFKMTINEGPKIDKSMDAPVTLDSDQIAEIIVPDGSTLTVSGPAKLNVFPRGFHLIEGNLIAKVTKSRKDFKATTPHGKISVLGTIFSCDTTSRRTTVKVLQGKVRVTPDQGQSIILTAGESTEMQNKIITDSETIPSIDSE
jgi:hypothetical protein